MLIKHGERRKRIRMKTKSTEDTIFALSTPVGGAIAVIRVSGKLARPVLEKIFTGGIRHSFLAHGRIHDGEKMLDDAMAVYFEAPHSYTGEDMFELDIHGSYAVANAVSECLQKNGLRPAEAGEFTKRAFLAGKMDLVQADAVMDLINAETERAKNAALEQLKGGLSQRIHNIEESLLNTASALAAALDYPEETEDDVLSTVPAALDDAIKELNSLIEAGKHSKLLREGAKLVILGKPNVGKSSLMNFLISDDRAIVTPIAGTTRDIIEESLSIRGIPVRLTDTAGIRETTDTVESIGIDRAMKKAESAELILLVFDSSETFSKDDEDLIRKTADRPRLFVVNKLDRDIVGCDNIKQQLEKIQPDAEIATISCKTGEGMDALIEKIAEMLGISEERGIVTNQRHIECMENAVKEIENAKTARFTDVIADCVDSALNCLGEITGREFSEELLDRIFERFCVGK